MCVELNHHTEIKLAGGVSWILPFTKKVSTIAKDPNLLQETFNLFIGKFNITHKF